MQVVETRQEAVADPLHLLNSAQRMAAEYGDFGENRPLASGPLLVIAGAGTGKTMTLAHRVAHLLLSGVSPERILLLTFTRRAADEMTRRVESIVAKASQGRSALVLPAGALPWSGTFHSIANRLLRRYAHNLGLDPGFSILDRSDAADVMDIVRHEHARSATSRRFPKKDTCLAIYSRCVNTEKPLADTLQRFYPWCGDWQDELGALFRDYVVRKQKTQVLDYDDLLLYWQQLVAEEEFATEIGSWFDHVLIDEYQDTNLIQAAIINAIKPDGLGVTVVGDDAQSIYSFRAAEVENILSFPDQYMPTAKVITLEQNYRSSQPLLDSANQLIAESARQYRKNLFSTRTSGDKPAYVTVEDTDSEAEFVVQSVLENRECGMQLKDQAVLFRSSHHSDRLELELVRRNIPYVKYGGLKFLEAAHVKDFLAVLKWADNPKNEVAAFRVMKLLPGVGPTSAARCFEQLAVADFNFSSLAQQRVPGAAKEDWPAFCALMESLTTEATEAHGWQAQLDGVRRWYQPHLERLYDGFETRTADLEQLEQISGAYASRERFLTELTLDPPSASGDLAGGPMLDEDYLILSTVHSAKGQEWDAVFVLNVTDGNFPSEFAAGKDDMIEEERRLMYVAMTRAKQSLALLAPLKFHVTAQRRDGDKHVYGARSRFLTEPLMATMKTVFKGRQSRHGAGPETKSNTRIDAAARMREMW